MMWDTYSFDLCQMDFEQFMVAYGIDSKEITALQEPFQGEKDEIRKAPKRKLKYYFYQMIRSLVEGRQEEALEELQGRKKFVGGDAEEAREWSWAWSG